ncbi:MAG TPA: hypothetical protein VFH45_02770 [Acidimicrobiales bacterium]|nr:hypothetical protein [Acidimicrobiales bacterium]
MVSVFVLRLRPEELSEGRIVGQAEHVASGHNALIRSADELTDLLLALARQQETRSGPEVSAPSGRRPS